MGIVLDLNFPEGLSVSQYMPNEKYDHYFSSSVEFSHHRVHLDYIVIIGLDEIIMKMPNLKNCITIPVTSCTESKLYL